MKRIARGGWCLGLALCGLAALAGPDPEAALLDRLYTKFATAFLGGQSQTPGTEVLLLSNPGLPITPEDLRSSYKISLILDQIPLPTKLYAPSGSCLSATYETVLRFAQPSAFESMADRFAALKAKRALYDRLRPGKPTPLYAEYLKYRWRFLSAMDARTIAATEVLTTGKPLAPELDRAVTRAMDAWKDTGHKAEVEEAMATMNKFFQDNTKAWFQSLSEDLLAGAVRDEHPAPWYPVLADPPLEEWLSAEGWSPLTYNQSERPLPAVATPAAGDRNPGQAGSGLAPGWLESLALSVETKRVKLTRTWLSTALFKNRNWRLGPGCGFSLLATGNPADRNPGLMPLVVTGVLLGRNLVMKGAWTGAGDQGQPHALGPFSLAVPGSDGKGGATITKMGGEMTITSPVPQVIGFFCEIVPRSPDPDPKTFR